MSESENLSMSESIDADSLFLAVPPVNIIVIEPQAFCSSRALRFQLDHARTD